VAVYVYALQVLLGSLFKIGLILIIGAIIGAIDTTILAVLTFVITRRLAGGVHSQSYRNCFLIGATVLLTISKAVKMIAWTNTSILVVLVVSLLYVYYVIQKYVPGETAHKQFESSMRIQLKGETMRLLGFWIIAMLILCYLNVAYLALAMALALVFEMFTVTPGGYHLVHIIDNITTKEATS